MSRMSYPWAANRRASLCTLVTSGQVASIVCRLRALASAPTSSPPPCAPPPTAAGHACGLLAGPGTALFQRRRHVLVVDDLLAHVDRGAVTLQRHLDGLHCTIDPGAVAPGLGQQYASRWHRHASHGR